MEACGGGWRAVSSIGFGFEVGRELLHSSLNEPASSETVVVGPEQFAFLCLGEVVLAVDALTPPGA